MRWSEYYGGQRRAIIYGAVYEGLASTADDAVAKLDNGEIEVCSTQQFGCIGSVAGIYTASMPVLIVRDDTYGGMAFCNLYEGESRHRLNYGAYNNDVKVGLRWLESTMAPVLNDGIEISGPIGLQPIMARALRMGDELHSRNTAGTILFQRSLNDALFHLASRNGRHDDVSQVLRFFQSNDYTFLRLSMAAAKASADAAHGIEHSSLVTGMTLNCREFAIRVSGLGDEWFRGEFPTLEGRFFDGYSHEDAEWIGGESCFTESVGLGGFAQACAPALMNYQGGTFQSMVENNKAMYQITHGEHPHFLIPPFNFRGTPTGIDIFKVIASGVTPVIDGGLAGKGGGQIGAGTLRTRDDAFRQAVNAYEKRYRV